MLADEQREVSVMEEGNIAVAVGMKNVSCGSEIVSWVFCPSSFPLPRVFFSIVVAINANSIDKTLFVIPMTLVLCFKHKTNFQLYLIVTVFYG